MSFKRNNRFTPGAKAESSKGAADLILHWDDVANRSNLKEFIEKREPGFMAVCPVLFRHLKTPGLKDELTALPTMEEIIQKAKDDDESDVILEFRLKQLQIDTAEQKALQKESVKGYAYIWEALSSESIARLRQEANFRTTVEESKHVYGLLQTIHKTHTLGLDPARSDEEQWYLIERRIFNLQQKEKETAVEFATRWENMIREMQSMFRDRALKEREKENDAIRDKLLDEGPLSRDNINFLARKRQLDEKTVNSLQYLSEEQMYGHSILVCTGQKVLGVDDGRSQERPANGKRLVP